MPGGGVTARASDHLPRVSAPPLLRRVPRATDARGDGQHVFERARRPEARTLQSAQGPSPPCAQRPRSGRCPHLGENGGAKPRRVGASPPPAPVAERGRCARGPSARWFRQEGRMTQRRACLKTIAAGGPRCSSASLCGTSRRRNASDSARRVVRGWQRRPFGSIRWPSPADRRSPRVPPAVGEGPSPRKNRLISPPSTQSPGSRAPLGGGRSGVSGRGPSRGGGGSTGKGVGSGYFELGVELFELGVRCFEGGTWVVRASRVGRGPFDLGGGFFEGRLEREPRVRAPRAPRGALGPPRGGETAGSPAA